jgi:glycine/D-amino acid oxidase-like deaminating enzyme
MPGRTCEVLIIGGGLAGTAVAYNLAKAGADVLLLEAGSICSGTSGACAGRAQLIESETEEYLDLALEGFEVLGRLSVELEADLEWELPGHLTLLFTEDQQRQYAALTGRLNRHGVEAAMLDRPALHEAEPKLAMGDCLGAAYSKEGRLNPLALCMGFARAARRHGAMLRTRMAVSGFERQAGRIKVVRAGHEQFSAGTVLLAAGAWTGKLAASAGSQLPMRFSHAEAVVSEPLPRLIFHHIGMSGFYEAVHGQERTVTLGVGQHRNGTLMISNAIQKADTIDMRSTAWGLPALAKALASFLPCLKDIGMVRTWAAPSPYLPDYQPAIGWVPGLDNLYVAAGFHLAVSTIPLLAERIAKAVLNRGAAPQESSLSPFSPERFHGLSP